MELLGIGKQDKLSRYNLNQLIEESLALFEHDLKTKNIKLITNLSSILPEIEIYPNRIKQVFLNLILNTLEAMPKGGELRISSNVVFYNNKKYLQLEFRDTGPGIPRDKKDLIFDPSYTTKNSKGMGLGLFISKNIIEEHGGKIEVDSEKMRGTRFIIRFPIQLMDRIKVA
jgi:signal transduction histidine kinase